MNNAKLARMANDIADFFKAYPADQASAGIHDHIQAFWTPKMRATLRGEIDSGTAELHPLVVEAMTLSSHGRNPAAREAAGPAEAGELGASDAG